MPYLTNSIQALYNDADYGLLKYHQNIHSVHKKICHLDMTANYYNRQLGVFYRHYHIDMTTYGSWPWVNRQCSIGCSSLLYSCANLSQSKHQQCCCAVPPHVTENSGIYRVTVHVYKYMHVSVFMIHGRTLHLIVQISARSNVMSVFMVYT